MSVTSAPAGRRQVRGIRAAVAGAALALLPGGSSVPLVAQGAAPTCEEGESPRLFPVGQINSYSFPAGVQSLRIIIAGGSGGDSLGDDSLLRQGGAGAVLEVLYESLAAGEILAVLVGRAGETTSNSAGGGGGATYVARGVGAGAFQIANLVAVAGGGGGASSLTGAAGGSGGTFDGDDGGGGTGGAGGNGDTGGAGGDDGTHVGGRGGGGTPGSDGADGEGGAGGGGGGYGGDGGSAMFTEGGFAAANGGSGGSAPGFADGGFGGGGSALGGGGGGGGFVGGGGGAFGSAGGGGSSRLDSVLVELVSIAATNEGDGFALFCQQAQAVPAIGPIALLAAALLLIAVVLRRIQHTMGAAAAR